MIDPVIFSFKFIYWTITLRWYGVLVMLGVVVGTWIAEKEIKRRGENGDVIWDGLIWILPTAIVGARIWYILNSLASGSTYYLDNPAKIMAVWEGGLHFFGGLLFGAVALYYFLKSNGMDVWLFLDAIAPAALIGQALARPANYINQELYGPPTKLAWGILINNFGSRLPQYQDIAKYPLDTTLFHPTFAYEMILNIFAALVLLWIAREYRERVKPGAIFAGWLISAGLIRAFIEFFRPDQPRIGDSFVTTSMLVSALMAVAGIVMLMIRNGKLMPAVTENWEDEYFIAEQQQEPKVTRPRKAAAESVVVKTEEFGEDEAVEVFLPVKKKRSSPRKSGDADSKARPKAGVKKAKKE
jgi:phosphatidylglycerol:prolipoprotein diacylglycerol transferase